MRTKTALVITLLFLGCFSFYLIGYSLSNESPENVVKGFIEAVFSENVDLAEKRVINEPSWVQLRINGFDESKISENTFAPGTRLALNQKDLVKELFPDIVLFQSRNKIEILDVQEHDNEARVKVAFSNKELKALNYEFLLIKTNGRWLIFKTLLISAEINYDNYDFYAKPKPKK